jgi:hypothetical protein
VLKYCNDISSLSAQHLSDCFLISKFGSSYKNEFFVCSWFFCIWYDIFFINTRYSLHSILFSRNRNKLFFIANLSHYYQYENFKNQMMLEAIQFKQSALMIKIIRILSKMRMKFIWITWNNSVKKLKNLKALQLYLNLLEWIILFYISFYFLLDFVIFTWCFSISLYRKQNSYSFLELIAFKKSSNVNTNLSFDSLSCFKENNSKKEVKNQSIQERVYSLKNKKVKS